MDDSAIPLCKQDAAELLALTQPPSVRDFIRDNFGLYAPPADYRALREENLKRTAKALLPR